MEIENIEITYSHSLPSENYDHSWLIHTNIFRMRCGRRDKIKI